MNSVVFGRRLVDGTPDEHGPRLELTADSPILDALRKTTGPLMSNPVTGEWGASLVPPEEVDGEYSVGLGVFPAGADGPDEHVHPNCAETFTVIDGELVLTLDGDDRTLSAGDSVTVEAGTPHTFRNDSDALSAVEVEIRPPGMTNGVIATLFGLAHEGAVSDTGQPTFLQGMVLADATSEDTYFTSVPRPVMTILTTVFAPIGRALGYRAMDPKYVEDSFWHAHVEQPDWDAVDAGSA